MYNSVEKYLLEVKKEEIEGKTIDRTKVLQGVRDGCLWELM